MRRISESKRIALARIYDELSANDGTRILVDHLWPRSVSKERAKLDLWLKDIAPSTELRLWFGHDPAKWTEFRRRYNQELARGREAARTSKALPPIPKESAKVKPRR